MSSLSTLGNAIRRALWYGTAGIVASPTKAKRYWESMVWMAANASVAPLILTELPEAELEDILPQTKGVTCDLRNYRPVLGNVTPLEMTLLARIARTLRPRKVFEFGTFNGGTTLQLAVNTPPETQIFTLDLPYDSPLRSNEAVVDIKPATIGECFLQTEWAPKIQILTGDSQTFDYGPYAGSIDLCFVDASHVEEYAASDTRAALSMLAPGGTILWHDYKGHAPGVIRVLNRLHNKYPVWNLKSTSLAICRPSPHGGIS